MTWDPWAIKPDSEREVWEFEPLVRVGPLIFWMEHDEVEQAVGSRGGLGFRGDRLTIGEFARGFTTYYVDGHLHGVAIDALVGPFVRFEGSQLVGRPPSEVADWYGYNFERLEADYVIISIVIHRPNALASSSALNEQVTSSSPALSS